MPNTIDRRALTQLAREQRGSSVVQAAAVALVAMVLIGAMLNIVPAVGGQVERAMRCLIASLGSGASCAGGTTVGTPQADHGTPAFGIAAGGPGEAAPIRLQPHGRRVYDDFMDGIIAHWEITDFFATHLRPGAGWDVPIRGAGPNGGTGYADLVDYDENENIDEVWEIKPDNPCWINGAGQAQLQRYLDRLPNAKPGQVYDEFVVPASFDEDLELVVTSHGQPGMLYYYWRRKERKPPRVWPPISIPSGKPSKKREKEDERTRPPVIVVDDPISDIFTHNDDEVIVFEAPLDNPVLVGGGAAAGGILLSGYTFWRRRRSCRR